MVKVSIGKEIVFISLLVALTKFLTRSNLRQEGDVSDHCLSKHQQLCQERNGGRRMKWLVTLHPQSASRKKWCQCSGLIYFIFWCVQGSSLGDDTPHIQGGSSSSAKPFWKHPHRHRGLSSRLFTMKIHHPVDDSTETESAFERKILIMEKVQTSGFLHSRIEKVEQWVSSPIKKMWPALHFLVWTPWMWNLDILEVIDLSQLPLMPTSSDSYILKSWMLILSVGAVTDLKLRACRRIQVTRTLLGCTKEFSSSFLCREKSWPFLEISQASPFTQVSLNSPKVPDICTFYWDCLSEVKSSFL